MKEQDAPQIQASPKQVQHVFQNQLNSILVNKI